MSMYGYDGQNNPVGLLTDFNAVAYAYYFDPVNRADPTGRSVLGCIGGALSIAGGALGLAG